ncbi:MAG: hypothetical protein BECKG1743D_GA0114223_102446 [Candidatus Kentron sp. G]|nr:MAG: hypothetical protein BECKG1743F_GA0114225_102292 [Candidatus Kentron sp. G]VFM99200.1 MAG: hypothetical protein BECKG1743E_GA0114224_102402 [Candidatus Kentron sp. G]VFN01032.1 MAG: hypothetical protein BECKG1743D_GA0114223_102446 [Candidatus Kentron sp. G]
MLRLGRAVLLPGHFLFFSYAFHAAIPIRYWFAIDIAIRYRSYPAFSIASSDIDLDPERTTTPVAARATSQENEKSNCNLPSPK